MLRICNVKNAEWQNTLITPTKLEILFVKIVAGIALRACSTII